MNLTQIVDEYAEVHAEISRLEERAKALRDNLIQSGESVAKGTFLKAVISTSAPRVTTDWKGVCTAINPPPELIQAKTKVGDPVTSVRLLAL
jgi:hypothetical protein